MKKYSILLMPAVVALCTYMLCRPSAAFPEANENSKNKEITNVMNNKTYMFLADGFEETEALVTVDMLRRAGIEIETVSLNPTLAVKGAHSITVSADIMLADCPADATMYIIPGGMPGAKNVADNADVASILAEQHKRGGDIAAICAAPSVVLAPLGIVDARKATCYPGFEDGLIAGGASYDPVRVVVDGNIITANGPSSAIPFSLAIIEHLTDKANADKVAAGILN